MSEVLPLKRRRQFLIFREMAKLGPFDEFPMTAPDIDPQVHLSSNDRNQPFYLICEKDTVLAQISGRGRVSFRDTPLAEAKTEPGTFVYVPGGVPHRVLVDETGAQVRYKAREAGLEAVVFACPNCNAEVHRSVWDTTKRLPQEGWLDACSSFNDDAELRRCRECATEHPVIDLAPFRWGDVSATLRHLEQETAEEDEAL